MVLNNAERLAFEQRRQAVVSSVAELLTSPGAVAESFFHFATISAALGIEKKLDQLVEESLPRTRGSRRDESTNEVLVAVLVSVLNRLLSRPPLKLT